MESKAYEVCVQHCRQLIYKVHKDGGDPKCALCIMEERVQEWVSQGMIIQTLNCDYYAASSRWEGVKESVSRVELDIKKKQVGLFIRCPSVFHLTASSEMN